MIHHAKKNFRHLEIHTQFTI